MLLKRQEISFRSLAYGTFGLAFLNLVLFQDVLFRNPYHILSSSGTDLFLHFVAWREFAFDQLRKGHLTLWNPHYLCGTPFFGNFESALLYPPNWLCLILPIVLALNLGIVLHVFLAGFFTFLWAYFRGLHWVSSFLAGIIFMYGGAYYLHLYAGHLPNLCSMVWAPLIFLVLDGLQEEGKLGWILLGVFSVTMQILAGHPQYVYFTAIMALIYGLFQYSPREDRAKCFGAMGAVYLGAFFVTAVQLWTGLQVMMECGRNIPMNIKVAGSFLLSAPKFDNDDSS